MLLLGFWDSAVVLVTTLAVMGLVFQWFVAYYTAVFQNSMRGYENRLNSKHAG